MKKFTYRLISAIVLLALTFGSYSNIGAAPASAAGASSNGAATIDDWLRINGSAFTYKGKTVLLRGTNFNNGPGLGGNTWLPVGDITKIPVSGADYQKLREMGGNHVRFGLDYGWYTKDKAQFYSVLDQHVAWSKEAGIWFLPVMFILPGNCYEGYSAVCPFWDNETYKQQLKDFWVDFMTHYANEPTVIGIDVQNEPNVGASQNWSAKYFWTYAQTVRDAVVAARLAINPNSSTLVFIEAGSSPNGFINLGANVVYEEHMYMPSGITHGAKSNTPFTCTTGAVYPGASSDWGFSGTPNWDKSILSGTGSQSILKRFAVNWAKTNNVPYYIGEWGARSACAGADQYIADVADILNQNGVNYAHFNWRSKSGNFDIFPSTGALTIQNQKTYDTMLCAWKDNLQPVLGTRAALPASCSGVTPLINTPTPIITQTTSPLPTTPVGQLPTVTFTPTATPTASPAPVLPTATATAAMPTVGVPASPTATLASQPQTSILPPGNWNLFFGDEFDGSSVDTSKWRIVNDTRTDDQNKTFYRPENVAISNGVLNLTINNAPITAANYLGTTKTANYTGGMLESYDATNTSDSRKFRNFNYGYFEARIKYHMIGCGFWSNFWMFGRPIGPAEFDMEIMSCTGTAGTTSRANQIRPAYHYLNTSGANAEDYNFSPLTYNDTWHVYGILWLPNQPIKYFIDGVEIYTASATAVTADTWKGSPSSLMYMALRAGAFYAATTGGLPTSSTEWPGLAQYDWVRVYSLSSVTAQNTQVVTPTSTPTASPAPVLPTATATATMPTVVVPASPTQTAIATSTPKPITPTNTPLPTLPPAIPGTNSVDVRVSSGQNDVEENSSGWMYVNSSDLELIYDKSAQVVGIRFTGVKIPNGAVITKAYIQFKVDQTSSQTIQLAINGEASANASAFATSARNVSKRTRTSNSVIWSPSAWSKIGETGVAQQTPNLKSIVQEIINQPNWVSGNSLVFVVTGKSGQRVAKSFEGDAAGAPLLHVEFSIPASKAPVISPTATLIATATATLMAPTTIPATFTVAPPSPTIVATATEVIAPTPIATLIPPSPTVEVIAPTPTP